MAAKVVMTQMPEANVGKAGSKFAAEFEVKDEDDKLLGRLLIAKGGVEWRPKSKKRNKSHTISWKRFIELMRR